MRHHICSDKLRYINYVFCENDKMSFQFYMNLKKIDSEF